MGIRFSKAWMLGIDVLYWHFDFEWKLALTFWCLNSLDDDIEFYTFDIWIVEMWISGIGTLLVRIIVYSIPYLEYDN